MCFSNGKFGDEAITFEFVTKFELNDVKLINLTAVKQYIHVTVKMVNFNICTSTIQKGKSVDKRTDSHANQP